MDSQQTPKWHSDMSEAEYAALPYLSASKIRVAIKHNHDQALKVFSQTSFDDPNALGKWLHYFLLEAPQTKPEECENCPTHLHESIHRALEALESDSDIATLIKESQTEETLLWYDSLVEGPAKARLDIYHPTGIWDLKCLRGGSDFQGFEKRIKKMSWHVQAWWYRRAVEQCTAEKKEIGFIVLDTQRWTFKKYFLEEDLLIKASNQARESIRKLKRWGLI